MEQYLFMLWDMAAPVFTDIGILVAVILAAFTILFAWERLFCPLLRAPSDIRAIRNDRRVIWDSYRELSTKIEQLRDRIDRIENAPDRSTKKATRRAT